MTYQDNPYNFVPLNPIIVPSDSDTGFDQYHKNRESGYIDFVIEPKSPLFIRGKKVDFYRTGNDYAIPGSSLKGMISHLIEVISYSRVRFHENVPQALKKNIIPLQQKMAEGEKADFAEFLLGKDPIHGKTDSLMQGKLIFEDAVSKKQIPDKCFSLKVLKKLFEPKPGNTFYYTDEEGEDRKWKGNKFYWQKEEYPFDDTLNADLNTTYKFNATARVLTKFTGAQFAGRIRYENLTKTELGILFLALRLKEGCFHRIGMGKPYGMGCIQLSIKPRTRINRAKRYETVLLKDMQWNLAKEDMDETEENQLRNHATFYLLNSLGETPGATTAEEQFWALPRMQDLLNLHELNPFNLDKKLWKIKTGYPPTAEGLKLMKPVQQIRDEMIAEAKKARKNGH